MKKQNECKDCRKPKKYINSGKSWIREATSILQVRYTAWGGWVSSGGVKVVWAGVIREQRGVSYVRSDHACLPAFITHYRRVQRALRVCPLAWRAGRFIAFLKRCGFLQQCC